MHTIVICQSVLFLDTSNYGIIYKYIIYNTNNNFSNVSLLFFSRSQIFYLFSISQDNLLKIIFSK